MDSTEKLSKEDKKLANSPDVFEKIISGEAPGSFVYRDDKVSAFLDIQPVNEGHILVVPNQPAKFLSELDPLVAGHMFVVGQKIAEALRRTELPCEGVNFLLADGSAAGQEVPHIHLHVFPRYKNDGFRVKFGDDYFNLPSRERLDSIAEMIRSSLSAK